MTADPAGGGDRAGGRAGVLFDLDGTLVDTNYLHTLAWSRALEDAGEWAPMHAIHRLVGRGGDTLLPELLGHDCPAAETARTSRYRELIGEARVFPGAGDLVVAVHGTGLSTALATSSPAEEVDQLLQLLGIADDVDVVTTADDVATSKPDPEVFVTAMHRGGLDPSRSLAVGDSVWDVEAARAAGIGCLAVESGGFSRHELREAGALHVYRDVDEIVRQLFTTPLALLLPT
jgi:HAD superfamily hydrolase (TIGR01509 family)